MKRFVFLAATLVIVSFTVLGCAYRTSPVSPNWETLLDGTNLDTWNRVGDANWRVMDGAVVADQGVGFLVSKKSYGDFEIRAEFWADADVNSGIFIRAAEPEKITPANSYEVNIFDKRPDPAYGTGAIVDVAKISPMPKAAGQWNVYEITAKGARLIVKLNGVETVNVEDSKLARGPIALQYAKGASANAGFIKFRKVMIRPL